ncbi:MAG TPA: hypothetical protein PLI62_09415, partial [Spirochaetota bacterium]|nr:hypothetical protein [Spirochaetota bacterium]
APTVTSIDSPASGATVLGTDTLNFTVNEAGTTEVQIVGYAWTPFSSGVDTFSSITGWASISGAFTVNVRSTDAVGNIGLNTSENYIK